MKVKFVRSYVAALGLATGLLAVAISPAATFAYARTNPIGPEMAALLYDNCQPATYQNCYEYCQSNLPKGSTNQDLNACTNSCVANGQPLPPECPQQP